MVVWLCSDGSYVCRLTATATGLPCELLSQTKHDNRRQSQHCTVRKAPCVGALRQYQDAVLNSRHMHCSAQGLCHMRDTAQSSRSHTHLRCDVARHGVRSSSAYLKVRLQYGHVIRVFSSYSLYARLLNASIASALVGRAMSVTSVGG